MYVFVHIHVYLQNHMWISEDSMKVVISISYHVGSNNRYQLNSFSSKCFYPLSHISNLPKLWFYLALNVLSFFFLLLLPCSNFLSNFQMEGFDLNFLSVSIILVWFFLLFFVFTRNTTKDRKDSFLLN